MELNRQELELIKFTKDFFNKYKTDEIYYHDWNHCLTTALRACWLLNKHDNKSYFNRNLFIAGMLHDIGYNINASSDEVNIKQAINLVDLYNKELNLILNMELTGDDIFEIKSLIKATQYPHKSVTDLAEIYIQDADLLQNWSKPINQICDELTKEGYQTVSKDFPTIDILNSDAAKSEFKHNGVNFNNQTKHIVETLITNELYY